MTNFCKELMGFCIAQGGFCPGGILARGDFVRGDFVRGDFGSGGFCPRGILSGGILSGGILTGGILSGGILSCHRLDLTYSPHHTINCANHAASTVVYPKLQPNLLNAGSCHHYNNKYLFFCICLFQNTFLQYS